MQNISIYNADSGILLNAVKNISLEGIRIEGERKYHHGIFTKNSHDCLIANFTISAPMIHGINSDIFGTGNVWSKGIMNHGTFDMHHGMQFDLIRTQIKINNDGLVGGKKDSGPCKAEEWCTGILSIWGVQI